MDDRVASRLSGGLGNQLFQFAAALGVAHDSGRAVVLDVSSFDEVDDGRRYVLDRYASGIPIVRGTAMDAQFQTATIFVEATRGGPTTAVRLPIFREDNYAFDPAMPALRGSVYLYGFWQSWRYFDRVSDVLRRRLSAAPRNDRGFERLSQRIQASGSVAVHVRRGDYLVPDVRDAFGVCELPYYLSAMALMRARIARVAFFVFSDDPMWCQRHFTDRDVTIASDANRDVRDDLALMMRCQHHIVANSSLSWWGAWLGYNEHSIVVAPIPWYSQSPHASDLIPKHWVRLNRRTGAKFVPMRFRSRLDKVSVVVLASGTPAALRQAVQTARAQTYANAEIIVALNNPTSGVQRAAAELAGKFGSLQVVASTRGRGSAGNAGIAAAAGDWIAFLDDRDGWRPDKLQIQMEAAHLNDANVVGCRTVPMVGPDGTPPLFPPVGPPDRSLQDMLGQGYLISGLSHTIVRRDVIASAGGFNEHLLQHEDADLWHRLSLQHGVCTTMLWDRLVMSPVPFLMRTPASPISSIR